MSDTQITVVNVAPTPVTLLTTGGLQGVPGVQGEQGPAGPPGESQGTYHHTQGVASTVWTINHGRGKYPSVFVQDSAGDDVEGDVSYPDQNTVVITFSAAFSGDAFLN